ncbi:uncharacterized protein STEHIDRAFT_158445 [Stereum hirsutum FP-91666 SS1]|uniref:uncharacterized protein n=1 Tax=Stereum hirsutum (strain FP-91666) TaxID=721885 RepID=UPI000444A92A|nr:uncharacterized protein STEHIDRAFT_158445 [Stereum hirsutum FP-91666 SS1]EIM84729.1 hypothetical protein STEHIDRAFT_158445 [Stereum hirsutum FP-91666 SS1]
MSHFLSSKRSSLNPPIMLQTGVYTITDATWNTAMDLSGKDNKSVISYTKHGMDNQLWEIIPLGAGYAIRSIRKGTYITVDNALEEESFVIATDFPVAWDIEVSRVVADRKDDEGVTVSIKWPGSKLSIGLKEKDANTPATLVSESTQGPSQQWNLSLKRLGTP